MIEKFFGSDLKIKILRELHKKGQMRFSEIRNDLNSGSGSTKKALENLTEDKIILRIEEGPKKLYFDINPEYLDFIVDVFELEKTYFQKQEQEDLFKKFFQIQE